jgi:hypothetical protein
MQQTKAPAGRESRSSCFEVPTAVHYPLSHGPTDRGYFLHYSRHKNRLDSSKKVTCPKDLRRRRAGYGGVLIIAGWCFKPLPCPYQEEILAMPRQLPFFLAPEPPLIMKGYGYGCEDGDSEGQTLGGDLGAWSDKDYKDTYVFYICGIFLCSRARGRLVWYFPSTHVVAVRPISTLPSWASSCEFGVRCAPL